MKKIASLFLILIINAFSIASAQTIIEDKNILNRIKQTPQEKIFIHYNTSLLFSGENLLYKVYNLNSETNTLSNISKIAYVELVGEDREVVFSHKIALDEGMGQGDYFVPLSVPSGNYKILGYTKWMKNGEKMNFFRGDIAIINPYRNDQEAILNTNKISSNSNNSKGKKNFPINNNQIENNQNNLLQFQFPEGREYGKRDRVPIKIKSLEGSSSFGDFSISVRKIDSIEQPTTYTSKNFTSLYQNTTEPETNNALVFLPELRGNLIKGKIELKNDNDNLSVANKKIAFSIPGEDFILKIVNTNINGIFYINLNKFPGNNAAIQVLGENKDEFTIELFESPAVDYASLDFNEFYITPELEELILERSIHNQIENAYLDVKPDTIAPTKEVEPFYGNSVIAYDLDDYTRFPTMDETFIEIIKSAWITKNDKGEEVFEVRGVNPANNFNASPLIIIDGIIIQDHSELVEYNARKIQTITVSRKKYYLGPKVFQGFIVFETIEGEFYENFGKNYIKKIALTMPQPKKGYYRQTYNPTQTKFNHIPDFRIQLLWMPNFNLNTEEKNLGFYTSDVPGHYEISLEGFTVKGEPVSVKEIIKVE